MTVVLFLLKQLNYKKWLFMSGVVVYLIGSGLLRFAPLLLQQLIDGPIVAVSQGQAFDQVQFLEQLAQFFLMNVLGVLVFYISFRMLGHCANTIIEHLRNQAYEVMQGIPIAYFDDKPAGKIATRIVNDTETLRQQFYRTLLDIFIHLSRLVFIYGILFFLNIYLGLLMLVMIPIFIGIQLIYKKVTDQPMKEFYDARSDINTQVNETMNGASLIQLFGQEQAVLAQFEETADQMRRSDNQLIWARSLISWTLSEFMQTLVIAITLTIVGYQFLHGQGGLSSGRLFIYIDYIQGVFLSLGALVRLFPNILRSLETGKRVMALLQEKMESDSEKELRMTDGVVEFQQVSFGYDASMPVLKDISIYADKGETIALVGHTGSGKSSIMNLLYRFYDPQKGQIVIDGQVLRDYSRESLRSYMGIVLQDPYLFTGTIASNVAMSETDIDRERVVHSLEKVGAGLMLDRLEKGIDEPVVEKGSTFSSGERQLISFARTLYSNPKILILDEATSHIDTETEEIIQRAMEIVKEGRTTFMIAHRLLTIQHADQILVLDEGRIIERGKHEDLLQQGGVYAHMYEIQSKI